MHGNQHHKGCSRHLNGCICVLNVAAPEKASTKRADTCRETYISNVVRSRSQSPAAAISVRKRFKRRFRSIRHRVGGKGALAVQRLLSIFLCDVIKAFFPVVGSGQWARGRATADARAHQPGELDVLMQGRSRDRAIIRASAADMPLLEQYAPYYFDWLAAPLAPRIIRPGCRLRAGRGPRPAYPGGWFDVFSETLASYQTMRRHEQNGMKQARLVVGHRAHLDFPVCSPSGARPNRQHQRRRCGRDAAVLVDRWLKHKHKASVQEAPVLLICDGRGYMA